jgi:hypothetical protein
MDCSSDTAVCAVAAAAAAAAAPSPPSSSPRPPAALSPCAACKILRRRCVDRCVLAPYFPPTEPHKFATAHRVFGASNIIKLLQVSLVATPCMHCVCLHAASKAHARTHVMTETECD